MGSCGGDGEREKEPRVRAQSCPQMTACLPGSEFSVLRQPGWAGQRSFHAGTVVIRGGACPPSSHLWAGFRRPKGQDISCKGLRLGLSYPRDHFPSLQWLWQSARSSRTSASPLGSADPRVGVGGGCVSQWRPLEAIGPGLRGWDLRRRILEMENVSPTVLSGLEAAVSTPHPLEPPALGGGPQARPCRDACCLLSG